MDSNSQGGQPTDGSGANSSGASGSSAGGGSQVNNPNLSGASGAPSIIDLSEDSMVRLPGAKDPVRYGDHNRTFQSEFTKRAQEASKLRAQLQEYQRREQENQRRAQSQQQQQQRAQRPNKLAELAQSLKSLTYLNGEQAAGVVEHLTQQFAANEQELQKRDYALGLMYKQMKQMEQTVNGMARKNSSAEFGSKIGKFVKDAGLPDRANRWAQELYLAYEGDDLDVEFPKILRERWEELTGIHEEQRKARVDQARRQPFVPGRGGNGSPSKPLANYSRASAKEIADAIWPGAVDG